MLLPSGSGAVALAAPGGGAVAVVLPAGARVPQAVAALHGALRGLLRFGGWARAARLWLYAQAVEPRRERLTAGRGGKFLYLLAVGARAGAGGAGAGGGAAAAAREAVLRPVLAHADAVGAACFTEMTDPADGPFFAGLGFAPADDFTMFGVPVVILVREPKA